MKLVIHGRRQYTPYAAPIIETNAHFEPDPIGSAVRVTFAAREYLATAGHVIDSHLEGSGKGRQKGATVHRVLNRQIKIFLQIR
jgi:hypothetical protein